jgi:hypothetical protein
MLGFFAAFALLADALLSFVRRFSLSLSPLAIPKQEIKTNPASANSYSKTGKSTLHQYSSLPTERATLDAKKIIKKRLKDENGG